MKNEMYKIVPSNTKSESESKDDKKEDDTSTSDKDDTEETRRERSLQKTEKDTKTTYGIKYTTLIEYRKGSNSRGRI